MKSWKYQTFQIWFVQNKSLLGWHTVCLALCWLPRTLVKILNESERLRDPSKLRSFSEIKAEVKRCYNQTCQGVGLCLNFHTRWYKKGKDTDHLWCWGSYSVGLDTPGSPTLWNMALLVIVNAVSISLCNAPISSLLVYSECFQTKLEYSAFQQPHLVLSIHRSL